MKKRPEGRVGCAAAILFFLLAGCAGSPPAVGTQAESGPSRTLYVAKHGWHSGLAVRSADIPQDAWPARREFSDARYLELGWGDREYYMRENPGIWLGLRALFWPTDSAIHAVAVRGAIEREFPASEIVDLRVSEEGFRRLVEFVAASHARDAAGDWIVLGPGQRPNRSRFYASGRRFHLFETCNTWVARALREAGVRIDPRAAISGGGLMRQVRSARRMDAPPMPTSRFEDTSAP
jgi:uncharacterized protein (TIGR02117 family)